MIPHERSLVKRLESEPFALIGVNSDDDRAGLTRLVAQEEIAWRSFWDGGSRHGPIATRWNVTAWPTIYVLDAEGRIRFKEGFKGGVRTSLRGEAMDKAIDELLAEVRAKQADSVRGERGDVLTR